MYYLILCLVSAFSFSQDHQTVVFANPVQPVLKIPDLMLLKIGHEFFKDPHHGILSIMAVFQVFHANPKHKVGITLKEYSEIIGVALRNISVDQLCV